MAFAPGDLRVFNYMELREWAHAYTDVGWNVFPLKPKAKSPHGKLLGDTGFFNEKGVASWCPLRTRRVSHELIDAWWDMDPNSNIGLVCGEISGVTVIDIDVKGKLRELPNFQEASYIRGKVCGPTLTSITGSGGMHLFVNFDPAIEDSRERVHPQIDIKNSKGYVVLPPSIHDETGDTYVFDMMFPFTPSNVKNLADFPVPLKNRIVDKQKGKLSNDEWFRIFNGVRENIDGRNNNGAKLVGKCMHALFLEFEADRQFLPILWEFVVFWNKKNSPPMDERELKHMFESIVSRVL